MVTLKELKILREEVDDVLNAYEAMGLRSKRIVEALDHAIKLTKLYDAMCTGEITKRRK